jgi:molybdopterin molybdotransferase
MVEETGQPAARFHDPRMRGFRTRTPVEEVVAWIDRRVSALDSEAIDVREAAGRVLAAEVRAIEPVPPFDRAAMDGYAVRGEETFGADVYTPAPFRLIGAARPGRAFPGSLGAGEAVQITTGAPLPPGADAVAKAETARAAGDTVWISEATPPAGTSAAGRRTSPPTATSSRPAAVLRPQDLGVLSALGVRTIAVIRRPRVVVIVTGDELLPAGTPARGFQIADMNSVMLAALIARDGGVPRVVGPLPDERAGLRSRSPRRRRRPTRC